LPDITVPNIPGLREHIFERSKLYTALQESLDRFFQGVLGFSGCAAEAGNLEIGANSNPRAIFLENFRPID
jgi:hypothetical protein